MKKLMFAAAVIAAGAAMAVESQVVGYTNYGLRDFGNAVTASFMGIDTSKADSFKLSTIKLTGFENNSEIKVAGGLISEEFSFTTLSNSACTEEEERYFSWYQECLDGEWQEGRWQDLNYDDVNDENEYEFDIGQAFWFYGPSAPVDEEGNPTEVYRFVSSGAVKSTDHRIKLRDFGNLVGSPMPVETKLSTVTITGYENNEAIKVGGGLISEEFSFTTLSNSACTEEEEQYFSWYDECVAGEWTGGVWQDIDYNDVTEDNEYTFKAGEGWWLYAPAAPVDENDDPVETYYVEFKTPIATK